MSDEVIAPQEGTSPEPEVEVEETTPVEETDETPTVDESTEETVPKSQFNQVLARAKKAEADLKAMSGKKSVTATKPTSTSDTSIETTEVVVLRSQGYSQDIIDELKVLAKVRGKTLMDTLTDPIFIAIKAKKEEDGKALKAKLPASRGSGAVKTGKTVSSVGVSPQEHKQLWKEQMAR